MPFDLQSDYKPAGDQPQAIASLVDGLKQDYKFQTLLGATGSGKTFTMAHVIQHIQKPTLVMAHNKTLVAQLCNELREFFPNNAVEYFVSYYDYYRPEAYIPQSDTYVEKTASVNNEIDRLRHSATRSLFERPDTIVVASVSCIYGLGLPDAYLRGSIALKVNQEIVLKELLYALSEIHYQRNDIELGSGCFRVRGDILEIRLPYDENVLRIELFDREIERISEVDPITGKRTKILKQVRIYPAKHFVLSPEKLEKSCQAIEAELEGQLKVLKAEEKLLESQRLEGRTRYDLEMLREVGYCNGVENYSRQMEQRIPGSPPSTLIDYFPEDYLMIIDESHVSLPQIRGMYAGDKSRKTTLVEHGFRLPSALDNRPLQFEEYWNKLDQVIFVSATPGQFELDSSKQVVEQIIRPTGLVDPIVDVRPLENQIDDLMGEIQKRVARGERTLVTTLTKKMAEDLTDYLNDFDIQVKYLHSDIAAIERVEILRDLRSGEFDVLIGVNLLREGLDLPEVSLVAILDADKEGFLRSHRSLIQTIGRAARNLSGHVILYGDRLTDSMAKALEETERRRQIQLKYNEEHDIEPRAIIKALRNPLLEKLKVSEKKASYEVNHFEEVEDVEAYILQLQEDMKEAAKMLDFERAAVLRDKIKELQSVQKVMN